MKIMKEVNVNDLLKMAADMEGFASASDALSEKVEQITDGEIDESSLFSVAAASSAPDFSKFMEKVKNRK